MTLVGDLTRQTLSVSDALVANALSTLAGTISLIPGGWGVTDGSLSGLLTLFGVGAGVAFSVALVFRFLDLLFRTVLGIVVLFARYRSSSSARRRQRCKQPQPAAHSGQTPSLVASA